jgi:hypothetical protein
MKVQEPAREGFLYHLWANRQFAEKELKTVDGRPVEIREKGVHNTDAGPDFINALVVLDGHLLRGDVEIHPVAGDWYAHGHQQDPKYNNVILHVVTMDCPAQFRTIKENRELVPTLNLDDFLESPAEEIEQEAEDREKLLLAEKINCLLAGCSKITKRQVFDHYGLERFRQKTAQFTERRLTESWNQIFYEALLISLGYSKNRVPFANLARRLPVDTLWQFIWNDSFDLAQNKCEAYLFGAAGLLGSNAKNDDAILDPEASEYKQRLTRLWDEFPENKRIVPLKAHHWQFFRLRPQNYPTRRIAAAAKIVVNFMEDGFIETIHKTILACENDPSKCPKEIETLFNVKAGNFWGIHFSFDLSALGRQKTGAKMASLLGTERARDISVNIVLPLMNAYALEIGDKRLSILIQEIYRTYPLSSDNEITRAMMKRIFSSVQIGKKMITSSSQQQGLIYMQKHLCAAPECRVCLEHCST